MFGGRPAVRPCARGQRGANAHDRRIGSIEAFAGIRGAVCLGPPDQ